MDPYVCVVMINHLFFRTLCSNVCTNTGRLPSGSLTAEGQELPPGNTRVVAGGPSCIRPGTAQETAAGSAGREAQQRTSRSCVLKGLDAHVLRRDLAEKYEDILEA